MSDTPPELLELLERARREVESLINAGDSGTVTIGYGNQGLRLVVQRHVRSVQLHKARTPFLRRLEESSGK